MMKDLFRLNIIFWLLAVLPAGAGGQDREPRPSVTAYLNNNPKAPAVWRNPIDGGAVDVSNTPGIMVSGTGFESGEKRVAVYFAGKIVAEGKTNIASGNFQKLLPLKAPLAGPRELRVRVGGDFSQTVPVRLRRLRGAVRLSDGSAVASPLVTTGLYRRSDFFVTAIGDRKGNFEILVPEKLAFVSIFENNSSKTRLECRSYDAGPKEGHRLDVCMEPHVKFFPAEEPR